MGFLDTGNKKHHGQHREEHLRLLSNNGHCVIFHRLTAYHLFLGSHSTERLQPRVARGTDLNSSSLDIELNVSEICHHYQQHERFFGYLSFFPRKFRVSRFTQKPFGLKNVFTAHPGFEAKSISSKWAKRIPNSRGEKMDDYGRIIEFFPNLRNFPISRDVGLGVGKNSITYSCRCEFPQDQKFQ